MDSTLSDGLNVITFITFLMGTIMFPLCREYYQKRQKTENKSTYVFAVGRVSMFALMLSIARGGVGIKTFIGMPSELFYRGTSMWETQYGLVFSIIVVCFIFVPIYLDLGITSVYEYLDFRFKSQFIRKLASATFVLKNIFSLGITVYSPSVVLNATVGIPYWVSVMLISGLAVVFTMFGNLKAAIRVDSIQTMIMVFISVLVIMQGLMEAGGFSNVYERNLQNDRFQFFRWSGDITYRVDTFSAIVGQFFIGVSQFGCQQNNVQRYMCMKNRKAVTKSLLLNIPIVIFLTALPWIAGLCIYATYFNCDPLKAGQIHKMDAILPFFVQDKMAYIPGFLGIFLSSIFTGSLCLTVSNLNSLAAVTWEDFLLSFKVFQSFNEQKQLFAIKILGIMYAVMTLLMAYIISQFSGIIEGAMTVSSSISGPLVGVFILAMLIPSANWKGAAAGMICGHLVSATIATGRFFVESPASNLLKTSVEGCKNELFNHTTSSLMHQREINVDHIRTFSEIFFNISFMYYCVIGASITVIVGTLVSCITQSVDDSYDLKLIHPIVLRIKVWTRSTIQYIFARLKREKKYTVNT